MKLIFSDFLRSFYRYYHHDRRLSNIYLFPQRSANQSILYNPRIFAIRTVARTARSSRNFAMGRIISLFLPSSFVFFFLMYYNFFRMDRRRIGLRKSNSVMFWLITAFPFEQFYRAGDRVCRISFAFNSRYRVFSFSFVSAAVEILFNRSISKAVVPWCDYLRMLPVRRTKESGSKITRLDLTDSDKSVQNKRAARLVDLSIT